MFYAQASVRANPCLKACAKLLGRNDTTSYIHPQSVPREHNFEVRAGYLCGRFCFERKEFLKMRNKWLVLAVSILAAFSLAGCGGSGKASGSAAGTQQASGGSDTSGPADVEAAGAGTEKGTIVIGSKDFTENEIVAEIYVLALEDAGFTVERRMDIASSVIHTSLVNAEVDLYPEYTGTGLISILQMGALTDPQEVYDTVRAAYEEQFGIVWLDYAAANDGQGLFVSREVSDRYGITTISDLQTHAGEIRFASQGEFDEREDGIPGLEKVYGPFEWKSSKVYDNGLKYQVVESGEADAAPAYTTEGRLVETDKFVLLEDDRQVWPPYNIAPVVRGEILEADPEIADILNPVSAALDTETVTQLNAKVDIDHEEYEDVAKEYYESIR